MERYLLMTIFTSKFMIVNFIEMIQYGYIVIWKDGFLHFFLPMASFISLISVIVQVLFIVWRNTTLFLILDRSTTMSKVEQFFT